MVVIFLVFWGNSTLFHSFCTNLHSTNSVQWFCFLHILANICYLYYLLVMAILTGMRWYLPVILFICISLMISNNKYLSMCLLAMCIFLLKFFYSGLLSTFLIDMFGFLILSCMSYYIFGILTCCQPSFANISSSLLVFLFCWWLPFLCKRC